MSLCINPDCKQSNPDDQLFCRSCGSEILLLGRYQVMRLLSEKGGFADTYEVMHHGTVQVLKVLKDSNPKAVELFLREFEVLNQSDHPGIPKAEEYFEFTPRNRPTPLHCLVMEKILGTDLEEYLKQRGTPIDERCAISWLDQISQILQVIHHQKLLHRDIKPSNIILQPDGQLALIDFGAVGRFDNMDAVPAGGPTFIFTPGYAAPEQTMGRAVPESDIFSLGRTFVYLLTGKQITAMRDANGEWNWATHVNHLSPQLVALIEKMMDQQVEQRPRSAAELLEWVAVNRPVSRSMNNFQVQPTNFPAAPEPVAATDPNATIVPMAVPPTPKTPQTPGTSISNAAAATQIEAAAIVSQPPASNRKALMVVGAVGGAALLGAFAYGIILLTGQTKAPIVANSQGGNPVASGGSQSTGGACATRDLVKKSGNNYGVIEIGSKGVKAEVVQALDQANDAGFKYIAREEDIDSRNTNPIDPTTKDDTVKAVTAIMKEMQDRFSIPCEQILIYGSSGVAKKAPHKDELVKAIQEASGRKMEFISADEEAKYVFDGVVPEWRRNDVITVDIGSGNTKGAFLQGANQYETYEVPVGTGESTIQIDNKLDDKSFTVKAEEQTKTVVVPAIRQALRQHPKLSNSPRIYLAGGIVWALATLTRPCEKEQTIARSKEERVASFTRLRAEDINTFYNNATRDRKTLFQPNLSACTPEQLKKAQKEIKKVESKFQDKNLIAGAGILRAFSQELNFAEKDSIFFARYAIEALPIGYLIKHLEGGVK
jgi:serine/threonine protein kinase